ncbi:MAG: aminotransferase class V-fold PLP-dependent enzyme [Gammaproteobacteria bacterium]|nr:MAG: aminotransferase class V-fold PLP-dependent enzyme [Gammaproteobacteria bacterium]
MPGRNFLFIPGPTNVPRVIQNAMDIEQEDMRALDLPEFTIPLYQDMKKIFMTETGRVFIFPSSGTGGWESAITNTLSPGDKVLASRFGQFSHLFIDCAQRHGLDVIEVDVEWGEGVPVEKFAEILEKDKNHEIKAVFTTHNETATGVSSDIPAVRKAMDACNHPALLFCDTVSGLASLEFRFDDWGVDLAISGSQKGLMLPTGLGIVCASQKALEANKNAKCNRCFFAWEDQIATNDNGYFPYTPPMNLLRGLRVAIDLLLEEGLENVWARHNRMATAVRKAVEAWGMETIAKGPQWQSDTVTAVRTPEGFDGNEVVRHAYRRYNLSLSVTIGKIMGQGFRIGHLGDMNELMVLTPITGAEMAMKDLGLNVELGSGVAAAQEYLRTTSKDRF